MQVGRLLAFGAITMLAACRSSLPPDGTPIGPTVPESAAPARWEPPPGSRAPDPVGKRPPVALPAAASCPLLCTLVTTNCSGTNLQWSSEEACLAACRGADWESGGGTEGSVPPAGNTLACRVAWAHAAGQDPTACRNTGMFAPGCTTGGALPEVSVPPLGGGKCVLGLYDSADGASWNAGRRAEKVILGQRVAAVANAAGWRLVTADVNVGLPNDTMLAQCDAVVTAFYDGTMPGARGYAAWLAAVIRSGRRVAILGDYGAYQDASNQEFVPHDVVNVPMGLLGAAYGAEWTGDSNLLQVTRSDKSLFRRAPNVAKAAHFLYFRAVADDVQELLQVTRKDMPDVKSAVVFAGPRGGMALTRYYEDRDGHELFSLRAFLRQALGF